VNVALLLVQNVMKKIKELACYDTFRSCDNDGFVLATCRSQCEDFKKKCPTMLNNLDSNLSPSFAAGCTSIYTYPDDIVDHDVTCTPFQASLNDLDVLAIVLGSVFGVIGLILIIALAIYLRKRKLKAEKPSNRYDNFKEEQRRKSKTGTKSEIIVGSPVDGSFSKKTGGNIGKAVATGTVVAAIAPKGTKSDIPNKITIGAGGPVIAKVKALFDYTAQDDTELTFKEGDKVGVVNKEHPHWWEGELNGKTGLFPSNYVEIIDEINNNNL